GPFSDCPENGLREPGFRELEAAPFHVLERVSQERRKGAELCPCLVHRLFPPGSPSFAGNAPGAEARDPLYPGPREDLDARAQVDRFSSRFRHGPPSPHARPVELAGPPLELTLGDTPARQPPFPG